LKSGAAGLVNAPIETYLIPVSGAAPVIPAATTPASIATVTDAGTMPASLSDNDYVTFDISNTALTPNAFYALMVNITSANASYDGRWQTNGPNGSYGPAQEIDYDFRDSTQAGNAPDWDTPGDDFVFYVSVTPEPTSLGLISLAAGPLVLRRRR
jgi:hypothetical protein